MQDSSKLHSSCAPALYNWMKDHRPDPSRVDDGVVCQLDWHAFWGIIAQPVTMGGHMSSGPSVCIPINVSIELQRAQRIRGVRGTKTCISCALSMLLKRGTASTGRDRARNRSRGSRGCLLSLVSIPTLSLALISLVGVLSPLPSVAHVLTVARLLTEVTGCSENASTSPGSASSEHRVTRLRGSLRPGLSIDILSDEGRFDRLLVQGLI